jgi:hypothetical protein
VYAAKKTHFLEPKDIQVDEDTTFKAGDTVETHCCPFCQSLNFDEIPAEEKQVESAIQVEWNMVDEYLKQGYVIVDKYAKNATMYKYKKPEEVKKE